MEEKELMSIESSGKSVDEAIFKGLQQMGISIDEVSIEIIQTETKGILGIGAKPAKVRLTQKPPEEYEVPDYMKRAEERRSRNNDRRRDDRRDDRNGDRRRENGRDNNRRGERPAEQPKAAKPERPAKPAEEPKAAKPERPAKPAEEKEEPARDNKPAREKRPEAEAPVQEEKAPETEEKKVINYTREAAEGNPAAEFVKGLIERMGAEGEVLAAQDDECLRLRIDSEMMGMLIGHRGETLDAMQYITGLVVNKNRKTDGYTRVTLNTEEYREKREETLRRLARKVASQVRATGRPKALEPMNPYERRVLHSALQNNPDVTTHSEGEEPNRRVVVTPRRKTGYGSRSRNRRSRSAYRKPAEGAAEAAAEEIAETVVENFENSVENAE